MDGKRGERPETTRLLFHQESGIKYGQSTEWVTWGDGRRWVEGDGDRERVRSSYNFYYLDSTFVRKKHTLTSEIGKNTSVCAVKYLRLPRDYLTFLRKSWVEHHLSNSGEKDWRSYTKSSFISVLPPREITH